VFLLANDVAKARGFFESAGLYSTLAATSAGVFLLVYLARAVENYVRHLHHKPYLPYSQPRFVVATAGYILIADGLVAGGAFPGWLPLWTATAAISAGLVCLIASVVMSIVANIGEGSGPSDQPRD